eukprot:TRINITY_DN61745_c0_g2_i1.p1 TRINITY_DN61745_c0_g2~~TRINITY_DN61745_c0_g2_i1.p1  ORF type:complete len:333 (+),score=29.79 TRINITY_DN61745_c0_g2_i1:52-1050(+)
MTMMKHQAPMPPPMNFEDDQGTSRLGTFKRPEAGYTAAAPPPLRNPNPPRLPPSEGYAPATRPPRVARAGVYQQTVLSRPNGPLQPMQIANHKIPAHFAASRSRYYATNYGRGRSANTPNSPPQPQGKVSKIKMLREKLRDSEGRNQEQAAQHQQELEDEWHRHKTAEFNLQRDADEDLELRDRMHMEHEEEMERKFLHVWFLHGRSEISKMARDRKLLTAREFRKRDDIIRVEEQRREVLSLKWATSVMLHWKEQQYRHKVKEMHRMYGDKMRTSQESIKSGTCLDEEPDLLYLGSRSFKKEQENSQEKSLTMDQDFNKLIEDANRMYSRI